MRSVAFATALTSVLSAKAFSVIFSNVDDLLLFNVRAKAAEGLG